MEQVWITGLGQCSSLGVGCAAFRTALLAGEHGIKVAPVHKPFGSGRGAPLSSCSEASFQERLESALRSALSEGLSDARLVYSSDAPAELPVVAGSNFGEQHERLKQGDFFHSLRAALGELGIAGELWGVSNACASGVNTIGLAFDLIRHHGVSQVLVCAYDLITEHNYQGLASLRALAIDEIRPFDKRRGGTLLGEGVAVLLLESASSARDRGLRPYGMVAGYGIANDGHHFTAPEPNGLGMCTAMEQALENARLAPEDIHHLNAHGTGTRYNDKIETAAVRQVFGDHAESIPITSTKPAIGHTMGAAGALEAMAALFSLSAQRVPPVLNYGFSDPECDLDYVTLEARPHAMRSAMSNSYGLWGCNASLVLSLPPGEAR